MNDDETRANASASMVYVWRAIAKAFADAEESASVTGSPVKPDIPLWCLEYLGTVAATINELATGPLKPDECVKQLPRAMFAVHGGTKNAFKAFRRQEADDRIAELDMVSRIRVNGKPIWAPAKRLSAQLELLGASPDVEPDSAARNVRRRVQKAREKAGR